MRHEQPHGERAILGESAFLKIDGHSALRDHRLIVPAADGDRHARISQDFDEGFGGSGLDGVHAKRSVSIEAETKHPLQFPGEGVE